MLLQVIGFAYVAGVTERRCPCMSRFGNFSELAKICVLAPLIFVVGPVHTIASHPAYSATSACLFNYCYFTIPFMAGINWTHFQRLSFLRGVTVSPDGLKVLLKSTRAMMLVGCLAAMSTAALVYHIVLITRSAYAWVFAVYAAGLISFIVCGTRWLHATHEIHLHHFFTACVLIPFTAFHTPVSAVSQALLSGVYIEGAAR